jgi:hypothetical protein
MEFIIYKTSLKEFLDELGAHPTAYVQTLRTNRQADVTDFVCVLSGFNSENRAVQFRFVVERIQGKKRTEHAKIKAQTETKHQAERLSKDLEQKGVLIKSGFVGGASVPMYGKLDE